MLRSLLAQAVPVVGTVAAVLYTEKRKGWVWATGAGVVAHCAATWLTRQVLHGMEAVQVLPQAPVEVQNDTVKIPAGKNPVDFANGNNGAPVEPPVAPVDAPVGRLEVFDRNNNVIKLPTAMGEP